jgi:hypothetical protein
MIYIVPSITPLRFALTLLLIVNSVTMTTPSWGQTRYPAEPTAPRSVADCKQLYRDFYQVERELSRQHNALGWGRGAQVVAGPCCMSQTGQVGWCKTFASHAAAWEAIHCCQQARQLAVNRCMDKVRRVKAHEKTAERHSRRSDEGRSPGRAGENLQEAIDTFTEMYDRASQLLTLSARYNLAREWLNIGNDRSQIVNLTHRTSEELAGLAIKDEAVAELVVDNLDMIGAIHGDVTSVFDRRIPEKLDTLLSEADRAFPGSVRAWQGRRSVAPNSVPNNEEACGRVAECIQSEMAQQGRNLSDFSFYERCTRRFGSPRCLGQ